MGKKSAQKANTALDAQSDIARQTLDVGKQLLAEGAPARQMAQNSYMGIAQGNVPGIDKFVAPQINSATQQFYLAKRQAESLPPGAARDLALRDLKLQEAGAKTGIRSGGVAEATARAGTMGQWGTQSGLGAYGGASAGYGNVGQQYQQMASSKGAMAGSAMGGLGGFLGGI